MYKRIIFFLFLSFCACLGIYVKYFRRPPTADILNANKRSAGTDSNEDSEMTGLSEPAKQSRRHWNSWIKANDFVQIGEVHNKCGRFLIHIYASDLNKCVCACVCVCIYLHACTPV